MIPLKLRRFWQTIRHFAVGILVCFCVLGLVPVVHGQTDRVSQLIANLSNPDPRIRQGAVMALGDSKDPRAVGPLIDALKDPSVRDWATSALSHIKDPRAVEPLIALLKNKNTASFVRASAAKVFGNIKDPRAIDPLIATSKDTDQHARWSAIWALANIGEPAVGPLIVVLKDPNYLDRLFAASSLSEINDVRAVSALLEAWRNRDFAVIAGADSFFIKRGEPGSEDALIEALNHYGDSGLATDFVNSGNTKLEDAARAWATKHGYRIMTMPGGGSAQWGSKR